MIFETIDITMDRRRDLADEVISDPTRNPDERETSMNWLSSEDYFIISSSQRGLVSGLLRHNGADIISLTQYDDEMSRAVGSGRGRTIEVDSSEEIDDGLPVVSCSSMLPAGYVSIKGSERNNTTPSSLISTPEQAQAAREAFSDE